LSEEQIVRGLRGDPFVTVLSSAPNEDLIIYLIPAWCSRRSYNIAALACSGSWPQIVAVLDSLTGTEMEQDGKRPPSSFRSAPP
jgi:hypothetical protein